MENHVGVMVICLPIDKRDVCTGFSTGKRTASIGEDACIYMILVPIMGIFLPKIHKRFWNWICK